MLEDKHIDAVPSPDKSGPGNDLYFSGESSYTIHTYRHDVDVVEIYVPCQAFVDKDDGDSNAVNKRYVRKMAKAIINFYNSHYGKTSVV